MKITKYLLRRNGINFIICSLIIINIVTVVIVSIGKFDEINLSDVIIGSISILVTLILGISTIIQSEHMANDTKTELNMEIKDRMPYLLFDDVHKTDYSNTAERKYTKLKGTLDVFPDYQDNCNDKRMYLRFYSGNPPKVEIEFEIKNVSNTLLSEMDIFYVSNPGTENEQWIPNCYIGPVEQFVKQCYEMEDREFIALANELKENGIEQLYESTLTNIEPNKSVRCHFAFEPERIRYSNWKEFGNVYKLSLGFKMTSIYGDTYKQIISLLIEKKQYMEFLKDKMRNPQYIYRIDSVKSQIFIEER
jgi:hypothetical protein